MTSRCIQECIDWLVLSSRSIRLSSRRSLKSECRQSSDKILLPSSFPKGTIPAKTTKGKPTHSGRDIHSTELSLCAIHPYFEASGTPTMRGLTHFQWITARLPWPCISPSPQSCLELRDISLDSTLQEDHLTHASRLDSILPYMQALHIGQNLSLALARLGDHIMHTLQTNIRLHAYLTNEHTSKYILHKQT